MKNLKVIQFLEALSSDDFAAFDQYIHAQSTQINPRSIDLFDILKKYHPSYPANKIEKKQIFSRLFPKTKYDEKRIYDLGRFLYRSILKFIARQEIQAQEELWHPIMLIYALEKRKLYKYIPKVIEDAEKQLENYPYKDGTFYYYQYLLAENKCNHILRENNRATEVPLQTVVDQIDYLSLIAKLDIAVPLANRRIILAGNSDEPLIEEAISLFEGMQLQKPILIELNYFLLKMLTSTDGSAFFEEVKKLLPLSSQALRKEKIYQVYLYAINFCSKRMKLGEMKYMEEMFILYKQMLEKNILFIDPISSNINFKNLITISILLKQYDWTYKFIENNQHKIALEYREGIISYSKARLHFAMGEFVTAQKLLTNVTYIDPLYRLSNDTLLLKIFYETDELDLLLFRCRAFMMYIHRDKTLSDGSKEAYRTLAKIIRKLAKMRHKKKKNLAPIKAEFEQTELLVERTWLKEKIDELEQP